MKVFVALLFVLCCVLAENTQPKNVEQPKQEKRSLSHGALDISFPSAGIETSPTIFSNDIPAQGLPALPADGSAVVGPSAVGISTNTNTFTTINQKVPVPYPVLRPYPVDRPVPYPVVKNIPVQVPVPQPYPVEVVKHVDRPV